VQLVAFPAFGLNATTRQHLALGAIFTVVSLARSYLLRRLFNRLVRVEAHEGAGDPASLDQRPVTEGGHDARP
jgi:hypothetical protein